MTKRIHKFLLFAKNFNMFSQPVHPVLPFLLMWSTQNQSSVWSHYLKCPNTLLAVFFTKFNFILLRKTNQSKWVKTILNSVSQLFQEKRTSWTNSFSKYDRTPLSKTIHRFFQLALPKRDFPCPFLFKYAWWHYKKVSGFHTVVTESGLLSNKRGLPIACTRTEKWKYL